MIFMYYPVINVIFLTPCGVRQFHSLEEHDKEVKAKAKGHQLRGADGHGEVYTTNLLVKLPVSFGQ